MPVDTTSPEKIVLQNGTSSAEIYHYGATVSSWKSGGEERIFLSKKAILNGSKAIRGGIPLIFPQFGTLQTSKLPQHGFGRISKWNYNGIKKDNNQETSVEFSLTPQNIQANLKEIWPHEFHLTYNVTLTSKTLESILTVKNTSPQPWEFTPLFHTYFKTLAIDKVTVTGLNKVYYVDKVDSGARKQETRNEVTVAGEVDRIYEAVKEKTIVLRGTGIGAGLNIEKENFPDVVVWNPWSEKAKSMADFDEKEYLNMICVEVGSVAKALTLKSGETWQGRQILQTL